jgi:hypothetical protein
MDSAITDPDDRVLFATISGSDNIDQLAADIQATVEESLEQTVLDCFHCEMSVGLVLGLRLANGKQVLVKLHGADVDLPALVECSQVQEYLAGRSFPCPHPLGVVTLGSRCLSMEEFRNEGDWVDAHKPKVRRTMARTLARLLQLTAEMGERPQLPRRPPVVAYPWPAPHNALFDFQRTAAGAEWIDAIAAPALAELSDPVGPLIPGHCDWSAKHFRFSGPAVSVVYDWDSLRLETEPVIVGQAAGAFTTTWYIPVALAPEAAESLAFIAEYEEARGRPFDAAERRQVDAALLYGMAYVARCEHALGSPVGPGSFRQALRGHRMADTSTSTSGPSTFTG